MSQGVECYSCLPKTAWPPTYDKMNFPEPVMSMSVLPKSKGDEDKISSGLTRLLEEDPTFKVSRDTENAETIVSGVGETHLDVIASKLKNKFGAEVVLQTPKVPYRETIKKASDVQKSDRSHVVL